MEAKSADPFLKTPPAWGRLFLERQALKENSQLTLATLSVASRHPPTFLVGVEAFRSHVE